MRAPFRPCGLFYVGVDGLVDFLGGYYNPPVALRQPPLPKGAMGRELTRQLIFVLFGMCAISVASLGSMGVALAVGERADALFHNGRGYGGIVVDAVDLREGQAPPLRVTLTRCDCFLFCLVLLQPANPPPASQEPPSSKGALKKDRTRWDGFLVRCVCITPFASLGSREGNHNVVVGLFLRDVEAPVTTARRCVSAIPLAPLCKGSCHRR